MNRRARGAERGNVPEMRCAQCGLPLSPARTICPRCGTAIANKAETHNASPGSQSVPAGYANTPPGAYIDSAGASSPVALQPQWGQLPATPWETQGAFSAPVASSPPQPTHDVSFPQLPFPGTEAPEAFTPLATDGAFSLAESAATARGTGSSSPSLSGSTWGESAGTNSPQFAPGGPSSAPSWGAVEPATPANTPSQPGWHPGIGGSSSSLRRDTPLPAVADAYSQPPPDTELGTSNPALR